MLMNPRSATPSGTQLRDPSRCAKHTCLHGTRRDANDLGDLFNRSLVVVDQVDELTIGFDGCWPLLVQFFPRPVPQCRKRLLAGNRQKRGRSLGSALEFLESSGLNAVGAAMTGRGVHLFLL